MSELPAVAQVVYMWGDSCHGKLGNGFTSDFRKQTLPSMIHCIFPSTPIQISCGLHHTLILTQAGVLFGIGKGDDSQLGTGDDDVRIKPCPITSIKNVAYIAAGVKHSAALTRSGEVFTWGENVDGVLGHGSSVMYTGQSGEAVRSPTFVRAFTGVKVKRISCGFRHMMALTAQGKVYTWGCGKLGRLGHGDEADQINPKEVEDLGKLQVTAICCGAAHSVIAASDARTFCWGANDCGQLGLNSTDPSLLPAGAGSFAGGVKEIACGTQVFF